MMQRAKLLLIGDGLFFPMEDRVPRRVNAEIENVPGIIVQAEGQVLNANGWFSKLRAKIG
jgi:hypothetical protein